MARDLPVRHQYRFFVDSGQVGRDFVEFPSPISHQIIHVLRLKAGDQVIVLDGSGLEYVAQLTQIGVPVQGMVVDTRQNRAETATKVHIFPAVLKGRKLDLVVQKCAELGAASFTPVVCDRSVGGDPSEMRLTRLRDIAREAAEQSGRGRLPAVREAVAFDEAILTCPARSLIFSGACAGTDAPGSTDLMGACRDRQAAEIGLFFGPEGGFTDREARLATSRGHRAVSLGPRTLRAETAAIAGTALTVYWLEVV